jgi:hypothetical protein
MLACSFDLFAGWRSMNAYRPVRLDLETAHDKLRFRRGLDSAEHATRFEMQIAFGHGPPITTLPGPGDWFLLPPDRLSKVIVQWSALFRRPSGMGNVPVDD